MPIFTKVSEMSDLCYFRKPRVLVYILVTFPIYVCSKLGNVAFSQIVAFLYWNDWEIRLGKLRSLQSGEACKSIILIYEVYQNEVRDSIFFSRNLHNFLRWYICFTKKSVHWSIFRFTRTFFHNILFQHTFSHMQSNVHTTSTQICHEQNHRTNFHIILFAQVPYEQMQLFMQKNKNYVESIDIDLFCPHTCNFV